MSLNQEEVQKIAHLARLDITRHSNDHYAKSLSDILDFVAQLNQADTDNIEPMAHPLDANQRLRDDKVTETNQRDIFQSIAPKTESGLYLVPKVME